MTKDITSCVFIGLLLAVSLSACHAGGNRPVIMIKKEATVSGETIRLADVAKLGDGVPADLSDVALGNPPWPGRTRRVSPVLIEMRMAAEGFTDTRFQLTGAEVCHVRRETTTIPAEKLVDTARECILRQFSEDAGRERVELEVLHGAEPVLVPGAEAEPTVRASLAGSESPVGKTRVNIAVLRDDRQIKRVNLSFRVRLYEKVAVAASRIPAGSPVTRESVRYVRRDVGSASRPCLTEADELQDMSARRTISAGQTITRDMLGQEEKPVVIEPHQRVRLEIRNDVIDISTIGRATCQAKKGEVAEAVNVKTGREVSGVAVAQGVIRVDM